MALGNPYSQPEKKPRATREEFMFDSEPIEAWRMWDVETIAGGLNDDMESLVRAMALATRKAPENPWEYMLAPRLAAVARPDSAWEPRDPQPAVCNAQHPHMAPHLDCECGYWALKTETEIAEQALGQYKSADAIGRVKLWGRFCEFEKGYRAEYAYPVEVWLLGKKVNAAMAAQLSEAYGVPVHAEEPGFMEVERNRKKEAEPTMSQHYQNILLSMSSSLVMPRLSYSFGSVPVVSWNEDTWPAGIVRPTEFWDEIQKTNP